MRRGSGILLHVTSLPSAYGIGDLGPAAYLFADFLAEAGQSCWQILPLTPICPAYGNSPYSSFSAFAGNHLLISPELMARDGFLAEHEIQNPPAFPKGRVDYQKVTEYKDAIFSLAFEKNKDRLSHHHDFQNFCRENSDWLEDYSLFISIKKEYDGIDWSKWPEELRDRNEDALSEWAGRSGDMILKLKFLQYLFFRQWQSLKDHCECRGIKILGDIPIYVNYDSSDVWANPGIFILDEEKKPSLVAGVPPDYFSETGQLWGHPLYNWDALKESGYSWWIKRIEHNMKLLHLFRLDHFRGFVGYWAVKAGEKTAVNGRWIAAPAEDFFNTLLKHFPQLPIIAEDLGIITPDVTEIMKKFGFPGMKVLLFAFGQDIATNPYAPHNHTKNCVAYTGTHDNNTIKGWFKNEVDAEGKQRISDYIGHKASSRTIHSDFIRLAMMSVADTVIIPMQDILGLGEKDRMNIPGITTGNWEWRLSEEAIEPLLIKKLKYMTKLYGRSSV
ncbi:MAG: 4-alpha-glucanotransferase [Thermodesulfovibrionia bacterium]|nr:4-alpha-glucanotransferase [Thermodesulfovibrionia bacterium]